MAGEEALEKYRKKVAGLGDDELRSEIGRLEDSFARVSKEMYELETSDASLDPDMSYKGKLQSRINNRNSWDRRLDAAITELRGRGLEYEPSGDYAEMCRTANQIFDCVRVVFATRSESGESRGYDLIVDPRGMAVRPVGAGQFKPVTMRLTGGAATVLKNGLLNNFVYTWGDDYNRPGNKGRARWVLDIYSGDGTRISFKGNAYRPHGFDDVTMAVLSAVLMMR